MAECILGGFGGNGLKQYNKEDCAFTDAVPIFGDSYAAYATLVLPQGITFGDIVLMRIHQYCGAFSGGNNRYIYKKTDTELSDGRTNMTTLDGTSTSIVLPLQTEKDTADSVLEAIIIAK